MLQWQPTLKSLWLTQSFSPAWVCYRLGQAPGKLSSMQVLRDPGIPNLMTILSSLWRKREEAADSATGFSLPHPASARSLPIGQNQSRDTAWLLQRDWEVWSQWCLEGAIGNRSWWSQGIVSSMKKFSHLIPQACEVDSALSTCISLMRFAPEAYNII